MTRPESSHIHPVRVYYEDTDAGGIVYHANYLKFIERARSEWVRGLGIDQASMLADEGIGFVVRRIEADYLRPAVYDDALIVSTQPIEAGNSKVVLRQSVLRGDVLMFEAVVVIVAVNRSGRPVRLPQVMRVGL